MQDNLNKYFEYRKRIKAFNFAFNIISWDSETVAPSGCFADRGDKMAILSEELYKIQTAKEYNDCVNFLSENLDKIDDEVLKHEISVLKKELVKISKIPLEEVMEQSYLLSTAPQAWANAKHSNNFELFREDLEKIVALKKKYISHLETDELKGYDVLLDEYEEGMGQKEYDEFFGCLKKELVPFIKKILEKGNHFDKKFASDYYSKEDQAKVSEYFRDVMCFDKNFGIMMESEHPFTNGMSNYDIRITNHYYENDFLSSIFSCIHETGHATYEANVDKKLYNTFSDGGASMAMHESQSRFYENYVGRSESFWKKHYPIMKETFKTQLKDVDFDTFMKNVNKVEASFIRTDADELTYPLHIMLRYDLEKKLFNNELEVKDLEKAWNELFKEYFGLDVPCSSKGVLQDIHWSDGSFGYFPTYALGSAYGAQILHAMKNDIDFDKAVGSETTKEVNEWLKEHIHKYGSSKSPKEIIKLATGEEFNPHYYVNYLIEKYSKVYSIK